MIINVVLHENKENSHKKYTSVNSKRNIRMLTIKKNNLIMRGSKHTHSHTLSTNLTSPSSFAC